MNKNSTAFRLIGIIGLVWTCLSLLVAICSFVFVAAFAYNIFGDQIYYFNGTPYILDMSIIGIVFAFVVLICLGVSAPLIVAYSKYIYFAGLSDEQCQQKKGGIQSWSVIIIIFAFPIGLVALIPLLNTNKHNNLYINSSMQKNTIASYSTMQGSGIEQRLNKLNDMLDSGLISDEEYSKIRDSILKQI